MPWKKYEINVKCRKCKTDRKMIFEMADEGPSFLCKGCHNYYQHPALAIIYQAGKNQGRKDLQREMRELMGSASYQDAIESERRVEERINLVERDLDKKLEAPA